MYRKRQQETSQPRREPIFTRSNILHDAIDGCNASEEIIKIFENSSKASQILAIQRKDKDNNYPLYNACTHRGYEYLVIYLFQKYPEAIKQEGWNKMRNPVHVACRDGDVEILRAMLNLNPLLVHQGDSIGMKPLFYACRNGEVKVIDLLLHADMNIDINSQDIYGTTALHVCCAKYNFEAIRKLLSNENINVYINDNIGRSAFYYLVGGVKPNAHYDFQSHYPNDATTSYLSTVKYFIALFPNVIRYRHRDNGFNFFHDAIFTERKFNDDLWSYLLENSSMLLNESDHNGLTPLHHGCQNFYHKHVLTIIKSPNIMINKQDREGKTALHHACIHLKTEIIDALLVHPDINVNLVDNEGNTPLHQIVSNEKYIFNNSNSLETLLNPHLHLILRKNCFGESAMDIANQRLNQLRTGRQGIVGIPAKIRNWQQVIQVLEDCLATMRMEIFQYLLLPEDHE
jgi:ankyrin repeat protein